MPETTIDESVDFGAVSLQVALRPRPLLLRIFDALRRDGAGAENERDHEPRISENHRRIPR